MFDSRLMMWKGGKRRGRCAKFTSSTINHPSHIPAALTLIELLVVIVILTTLVGGVIPVLSPNNDTRKIRAAARGLQGYITLAQTQAAQTGRPHGIAFRESTAGSGVALEVFGLEVPPPFAGFSTESRVVVSVKTASPTTYNPTNDNNFLYHPQFNGVQLYTLNFVLADGANTPTADELPLRMFRLGDRVDVGRNTFLIVDGAFNNNLETVGVEPNQVRYLGTPGSPVSAVECVWLNNNGQTLSPGLKNYRISRRPANSSESPYQLPAGIVIDMQGSVAEGSENAPISGRVPAAKSLFVDPDFRATEVDSVGIMFSPTGGVDRVIFNGNELTTSRVVLLLGRIENGGLTYTLDNNGVPTEGDWTIAGKTNEELQQNINWLNLDSRFVSIVPSNGRVVVSEAAFVNANAYSGLAVQQQAVEQISAAHRFADDMSTVGGN